MLLAEVQSASGAQLRTTVAATVRGCLPGEVISAAGNECNPCSDARQYTFAVAGSLCAFCPEHATCSSAKPTNPAANALTNSAANGGGSHDVPIGAILVPLPGYWHSSPRSPQVLSHQPGLRCVLCMQQHTAVHASRNACTCAWSAFA